MLLLTTSDSEYLARRLNVNDYFDKIYVSNNQIKQMRFNGCILSENELWFFYIIPELMVKENVNNSRYDALLKQKSEIDDVRINYLTRIKELEEKRRMMVGCFKQSKRNDILNEIELLKSEMPDQTFKVWYPSGNQSVAIIEDLLTGEKVYQTSEVCNVIPEIHFRLKFSTLTGAYLGEDNTVKMEGIAIGTIAKDFIPLSDYTGRFDDVNKTLKQKGVKTQIHKGAVSKGSFESFNAAWMRE